MFKKIFLGALLVGLIGVLVAGAVIRTTGKTTEGTTGRGRATTEYAATGNATDGQRGGRVAEGAETTQGGGRGGFGQGTVNVAPAPQADVTPQDWLSVTGTVVSAASDLVEIRTDAGTIIQFEGQPLNFAIGQGFSLQVGDAVTVSGFNEDGEFKIGKVTNLGTGASVVLRDASGRPGWAGRGRRG